MCCWKCGVEFGTRGCRVAKLYEWCQGYKVSCNCEIIGYLLNTRAARTILDERYEFHILTFVAMLVNVE